MSVEDRGVGVPANKQPNLAVGCRAPLPGSVRKVTAGEPSVLSEGGILGSDSGTPSSLAHTLLHAVPIPLAGQGLEQRDMDIWEDLNEAPPCGGGGLERLRAAGGPAPHQTPGCSVSLCP